MEPHLSPSSWSQLWEDEFSTQALPSAHSYEGQEPEALLVMHTMVCSLWLSCHTARPCCFQVSQELASMQNPLVLLGWLRKGRAALTHWLAELRLVLPPSLHRHPPTLPCHSEQNGSHYDVFLFSYKLNGSGWKIES